MQMYTNMFPIPSPASTRDITYVQVIKAVFVRIRSYWDHWTALHSLTHTHTLIHSLAHIACGTISPCAPFTPACACMYHVPRPPSSVSSCSEASRWQCFSWWWVHTRVLPIRLWWCFVVILWRVGLSVAEMLDWALHRLGRARHRVAFHWLSQPIIAVFAGLRSIMFKRPWFCLYIRCWTDHLCHTV